MFNLTISGPSNLSVDYVFDFGANHGQNLDYYLHKAKTVVAIEANPILCEEIQIKYQKFVNQKRLFIENRIIIDNISDNQIETKFYLNSRKDQHSKIDPPVVISEDWTEIKGIGECASSIIGRYIQSQTKQTFFCKFDLEFFDFRAVQEIFNSGIYPNLLSVELHDVRIFKLITDTGVYKKFVVIEGIDVGRKLKNVMLSNSRDGKIIEFLPHMAGPWGDDIPKPWIGVNSMRILLKIVGGGWRDLHVSKESTTFSIKGITNSLCSAIKLRIINDVRRLVYGF
jgi:hypothetical protein